MTKTSLSKTWVSYQEYFQRVVRSKPEHIAIMDGETSWSYQDLGHESDRLSLYLQDHGVVPDSLVVVFMEASYAYIVSALSILKSGGAFLPIPIDLPPAQVQLILNDAEPEVVLTTARHTLTLSSLDIDTVVHEVTHERLRGEDRDFNLVCERVTRSGREALVATQAHHLAFATYTSGTTGVPKGVLQVQRALVTSYQSRYTYQAYQEGERVACSIFFMWETLRPLMYGATTYVIPDQVISVPKRLATLIQEQNITEVLFTPSAFQRLIRSIPVHTLKEQLTSLRTVWLNGEVVSTQLVSEGLEALPDHTSFLNTYSICECHDVSNSNLRTLDLETLNREADGLCPVGVAVPGVDIKVMAEGALNPAGEGELYIGGQGLGRGYLHREELTQERFPVVNNIRYYATGDLAHVDLQGTITIKGRLNTMVKMRGYSVYIGAIEEALRQHPEVLDVHIFLRGDHLSQHLTAFVAGDAAQLSAWIEESTQTSPRLRDWLSHTLPTYMIPSKWVQVSQFPVHPISGKLDQGALWALEIEEVISLDSLAELPQNSWGDCVSLMKTLWARALDVEERRIQEETDFFSAGGHSLSAVDLVISVERIFDVQLDGDELYQTPVFEAFIQRVLTTHPHYPSSLLTPQIAHDLAAPYLPYWDPQDLQLDLLAEDVAALKNASFSHEASEVAVSSRVNFTRARAIFVTGATGYLGLGLLEAILMRVEPSVKVICLVRSKEGAKGLKKSGRERLCARYAHAGFGDLNALVNRGQVTVIEGDVSAPRMGVSEHEYVTLTHRVDLIFHCAAMVNLRAPYHQTKPSIVDGSREVISFASCGRLKTIHHISTNSVLAGPELGPQSETLSLEGLDRALKDGYSQAKWVAEVLMEKAALLGIPVTIYRPGNIGLHRPTGLTNPHDLHQLIGRACLALDCVPQETGWLFEFTPLDLISAIIVDLASLDRPKLRYHVVHPEPMRADDLFASWLKYGKITRSVSSWRAWREELIQASTQGDYVQGHSERFKVLAAALAQFHMMLSRLPQYEIKHLLQDVPQHCSYYDTSPRLDQFSVEYQRSEE